VSDNDEAMHLADEINKFGAMFDVLCVERHEAGAKEYGALTFLGNDVIRMMMEELADTANYCRYQFVKLMFLQERLETMMSEDPTGLLAQDGELQMGLGAASFKGVGETGWNKK
jgi:hypothetical protein